MKWQFFITHTIHQTKIPTLLDNLVTNTPSGKLCPKKLASFYVFIKT